MTKKDKKIIEDSERDGIPIFVLTAKDRNSLETLKKYLNICIDTSPNKHVNGIVDRLFEFSDWQIENRDIVKYPD